jgi:GNAT superfamily N-acetyltransferase
MTLTLRTLTGPDLDAHLDGVAALRIAVFRDWPYLYDGDPAYERRYLQTYRDSPGAILVGAFDGDALVGAATGTPMEDHPDFAAPLAALNLPLDRIFYCAESVLLPQYRGRGLGHRFFDAREAHARRLGRTHAAFASVQRRDDHPMKPAAHRGNEVFWTKRGYAPLPGAVATYRWKDVDQPQETAKPLQLWWRAL